MKTTALAGVLVALALAGPAHAQMQQQLNQMFASMTNRSEPGVHMGQRRGMVSGGSFVMRNRVSRPAPFVSFDPPRWGAGCGGIDLYGGSFSFISKEEFTNYLRSIASASLGYAFELGLKSMCPTCADTMDKLQSVTQSLNELQMDSCQAAQALVDRTGLARMAEARAAEALEARGRASDRLAASEQGPGKPSSASRAARELSADDRKQVVYGNIVWNALTRQKLGSWFENVGDQTRFLEEVMSLTGTVIVCVPGVDGCPGDPRQTQREGVPIATVASPTVTLKELVRGSGVHGDAVEFLTCRGDQTRCLDTRETRKDTRFDGLSRRVREIVLGRESDDSSGLIAHIAHNEGAPSAAETAFMTASGLYTGLMLNLAVRSPYSARQFANDFADQIAAEIVYTLLEDLFRSVTRAVDVSKQDEGGIVVDLIMNARAQMDVDREELARQASSRLHMLQYYADLNRALIPPRIPGRPTPSTH